jgi:lipopolysaccharide/colanic/teichoic acid biosynthesis glycosyltransferase
MSDEQAVELGALATSPRVSQNKWGKALKIALDYSLTILGLALISPLLLLLALTVKLDSPGPALYRRRVMGRGGTQFDAFKFRTMVVNGDEILKAHAELWDKWKQDQKLKDDPRITRSGRWMRKLSLDELPQLFNVLRGQMSLVGPRMFAPVELARYGSHAPEILTVKPGITGLWQISGRSDLAYEDRARLDLEYVRTQSFCLDLKLLMLTLPAVLGKKGAF